MTDSFDNRGKANEGKYALEAERNFKAQSKAVKMFGQWAAQQMGLSGTDADAYTLEVMDADFEAHGVADVIAKVQRDLSQKGIEMTAHHLENEYGVHLQTAQKLLAAG